jgi:hypothetical protein
MKDLFGYVIDFKRCIEMKKEMSEFYRITNDRIRKKICSGNIIHIDETPIQLQDRRGYVWVLTSFEEVFYCFQETREVKFLKNFLKNFTGIIISDFYPGYDSLEHTQQKCLIHLIRDLNDDLFKHPYDEELKYLIKKFSELIRTIVKTIDKFGLMKKHLKKHNKLVENFYLKVVESDFSSEVSNKYKKRFLKNKGKLFTFLNYDDVPWNNNNAERAVRPIARWRRRVSGQIKKIGIEDFCRLLSVYQTCVYKGINFLEFLLSKDRDIDKYNFKRH